LWRGECILPGGGEGEAEMLLDLWRECVQRREGNRDTHMGKGQRVAVFAD